MPQRRPFHETIIDYILGADNTELLDIALLIVGTKIPNGHDEIIIAWREKLRNIGWSENSFGVLENLMEREKAWQDSLKDVASFPSDPPSLK